MTSDIALMDRGASAGPAEPTARAARGGPRRPRGQTLLGSGAVALIALIFAFPILWMLLSSFKSTHEIISRTYPLSWRSFLPLDPTMENYRYLFDQVGFGNNLVNTFIVSGGQVVGSIIICSLAGYVFASARSRWMKVLFGICLIPGFLPVDVMVVPLYNVVRDLGLVSTYQGLFLPFVANSFGILLMRQGFKDIPDAIYEAARMDGCGNLRIFFSIALPNVRPALATLALVQFIWSWNTFFWPLVAMQNNSKQVAQVAMASLSTSNNFPVQGQVFAAASLLTIPIVVLALLLQRYYVRGALASGIK